MVYFIFDPILHFDLIRDEIHHHILKDIRIKIIIFKIETNFDQILILEGCFFK